MQISMRDTKAYAFSGRFPVFRNRIVSDILLCSPDEGNNNAVKVRALWATGCSHSVISKRVADFLALPGCGTEMFRTPFGGAYSCEMKSVKICVVLGAERIRLVAGVHEAPTSDPDCDITLGLDFITQGDFAISHDGEQLVLSFAYPPIGAPTDFAVLAPMLSDSALAVESCIIDERDAVESRRRSLIMLDYFEESYKKNSRR